MTETIHLGTYSQSHLGDCLCTTPFPRLLHAREGKRVVVPDNRNSRIVFANNPFIAGFAKGGVPLCSIARGYGHVVQRIAQGLELPIMGVPRPEIHLSEEEKRWARKQREHLPGNRPICLLSTTAVTDRENLERVNWQLAASILSSRFTLIQPTRGERSVAGARAYPNLTVRKYMALMSVADLFLGGTSGGSHVAAAFDVPAVILIWRSLAEELRFPVSGLGFKAWFLYPYHQFIAADDVSYERFDEAVLQSAVSRAERQRPADASNRPGHPFGFSPARLTRIIQSESRRFVRVPSSYGEGLRPHILSPAY